MRSGRSGGQGCRTNMRAGGPLIAWFTDPAGTILSVIQRN
jgi:hypothetical protein